MRASLFAALLLVGCGIGHSESSDDGGAPGGGNDGGDAGLTAACPNSVPTAGAPCRQASIRCEYGNDPTPACNTLAGCVSGAWAVVGPHGTTCPTPRGGAGCPSSYAAVPIGSACDVSSECGYPEGRCVCSLAISGPPSPGPAHKSWYCDTPQAGCPVPRPRSGTPCTHEGQGCDYGSCTLPDGTSMHCVSGAWSEDDTIACPLAAPGVAGGR
jgi:hypothetical protein